MLSKEEKKAIEELKSLSPSESDIETVLSMLKEKDKKIEKLKADNNNVWKLNENMTKRHLTDIFKIKKKDKQIDLMAEQLAGLTIWDNEKEEPLILKDKEQIKQYFERKAKE